jgi:hypothetical protein
MLNLLGIVAYGGNLKLCELEHHHFELVNCGTANR